MAGRLVMLGAALLAGAVFATWGLRPALPSAAMSAPAWTIHLAATDLVRWDPSREATAANRFPLPSEPTGAGQPAGPDDGLPGDAEPGRAVGAAAQCGLPAFADELLRRVNEMRRQGHTCGRQGRYGPAPELAWNERLEAAASMHAFDMARREQFSHDDSAGRTMVQRVELTGYRWRALAENIAAGQSTVPEVVQAFVQSEGHCANLMNPQLRHVALACVRNPDSRFPTWWTMNLAAPR